jgi:hypothetical protein
MRWTGHDSVEMALHYAEARADEKDGFAAFSKLPARGKFGEAK